jgi:hypothetical protein
MNSTKCSFHLDAAMTEATLTAITASVASPLRPWYLLAAGAAFVVMFMAILGPSDWFLNWVHVMSGTLWTGTDLFMGFVVGPALRHLSLPARRAVIAGIIPRTLILMPIITSTAGWFLAVRMGFLNVGYPEFWWVVAALAIVAMLTVQGIGILLPTNLRLYFEISKAEPDTTKIGRWMRTYVRVVAMQGATQVAIIVVMARFATGISIFALSSS